MLLTLAQWLYHKLGVHVAGDVGRSERGRFFQSRLKGFVLRFVIGADPEIGPAFKKCCA